MILNDEAKPASRFIHPDSMIGLLIEIYCMFKEGCSHQFCSLDLLLRRAVYYVVILLLDRYLVSRDAKSVFTRTLQKPEGFSAKASRVGID